MGFAELLLLGVALAMDAFAVTISNMFCYKGNSYARLLMAPIAFAVFQAGMPLLGYFLGGVVGDLIEAYAGIVTLIILGFIGGKMVKEGIEAIREGKSDEERCCEDGCCSIAGAVVPLTLQIVLMQAIATSIDAFAVGVSLRAENVDILVAVLIIGVTTLACCLAAVGVGKRFGNMLGDRAQIVGGLVLVAIGIRAMFF